MKQLITELCIITAGVVFFFALAATFGIPRSERSTPTAVAAEEKLPPAGSTAPFSGATPHRPVRGWGR